MEEVLTRAIGLVDMVWEREVQAEPLNSPEAKAGLKSRIFAALKEIQHDDVRAQYQTVLLDRFDAEFGRQKKQYGGNSSWNKTSKKHRAIRRRRNCKREILNRRDFGMA
jgi:DNA primase